MLPLKLKFSLLKSIFVNLDLNLLWFGFYSKSTLHVNCRVCHYYGLWCPMNLIRQLCLYVYFSVKRWKVMNCLGNMLK